MPNLQRYSTFLIKLLTEKEMSKDEYLEFITHQPYDAMGDFSFLLDEKSDKAENITVENENMNAD